MAAEKLSKKTLPTDVRKSIEHALEQDPKTLSEAQVDMLMSRRDYLTATEKKEMGITAAAIKAWEKANAAEDDEDEK